MGFIDTLLQTPIKINSVAANANSYDITPELQTAVDAIPRLDEQRVITCTQLVQLLLRNCPTQSSHLYELAHPIASDIYWRYKQNHPQNELDAVQQAKQCGYTVECLNDDMVYTRIVHMMHTILNRQFSVLNLDNMIAINQAEIGHNLLRLAQNIEVYFPDAQITSALETELSSIQLQMCDEARNKFHYFKKQTNNVMTYGEFLQYKNHQLPADQKFLEAYHLYAIQRVAADLDDILMSDHPMFHEYLQDKWQSTMSAPSFVEYLEEILQTARIIQIDNPVVSIERL